MTSMQVRRILRWSHIGVALIVGSYFYSPLAGFDWALPLMQFVLVPFLLVTGIAMWQQPALMKLLRGGGQNE